MTTAWLEIIIDSQQPSQCDSQQSRDLSIGGKRFEVNINEHIGRITYEERKTNMLNVRYEVTFSPINHKINEKNYIKDNELNRMLYSILYHMYCTLTIQYNEDNYIPMDKQTIVTVLNAMYNVLKNNANFPNKAFTPRQEGYNSVRLQQVQRLSA